MASVWFGLMIAFFVTHELDAVKRHEWRVLPLTSWLPDPVAERVFVWAHVPLTLLILWAVAQGADSDPAMAFSGFAVLHVVLHWFFRNHPENEFRGIDAWLPILAAGFFGMLHLSALL